MKQVKSENPDYNKDFYMWTNKQVDLLKNRQFEKVDLQNIIEEIDCLGKSDKRALYSLLIVLFQHLLKNLYVPEQKGNSKSWDSTISNCRTHINSLLKDSPSLRKELESIFTECYEKGRLQAIIETGSLYINENVFPLECPWNIKQVISENNKE